MPISILAPTAGRFAGAAVLLSIILPASLCAQGASARASAAGILGEETCAEIAAKGKIVRTGAKLELLPRHPAAEGIRAAITAQKPGIIVESAFTIPRPRPADQGKERLELAEIYGAMRSFGSMQGIEYYSASRKAMRVLYAESYRIDEARSRSALPDEPAPPPDAIPGSETILAFQRDLSLGANVYSYSFASFPDAVLVEATNLTRMSYGIFPAIAPEGFKTRVLVIGADDAIVFYSVSAANSPGVLRTRLGESLANRAEALFRWFLAKSEGFLSR
jgi:hypothetical protein